MDSNCGLNKCLFNCFLTAVITIAAIAVLDLVLYFGYAYFNVQKYYARDIKRWRDKELTKYGANPVWDEIAQPSDTFKASALTGNSRNIWSLQTDGNMFICKKPCDGTDDLTFWRKYEGPSSATSQISVSDTGIWGVSKDSSTYSNTTGAWENKGSWTRQPGVGLINIAMGPRGWVWGVNKQGSIYKCVSQWKCGRDWEDMSIKAMARVVTGYKGKGRKRKPVYRSILRQVPAVQVAVGNQWVWALTQDGGVYYSNIVVSRGKKKQAPKWTALNIPEGLKLIAVGLSDNLYAVGNSNKLYKCNNSASPKATWSEIKGAPNLTYLNVNNEMYGVDTNGLMWTSELL